MILFAAFLLAALAALASPVWWPDQWLPFALLKTLTTVLVIVHAARRGHPGTPFTRALRAGLVLSLVGDVALLWPQQGFLPGLVAFLLAHLAYLLAFSRTVRLAARPQAFVAYTLLAATMLWVLWPGLPGGLRAPVVAYVLCLAAMAAQTATVWLVARQRGVAAIELALARRAALGGLLFLCSDALLAFNRFHTPLPAAGLLILGSYWAAQWLIASALPVRR
jgi:uncharacterized membrane protein YhhN